MLGKTMWAGVILAGIGLGSGCSMMKGGSGAEAKAAKGDQNARFMVEAAHGSHAEIATSQLALQKASNPRVKEFAQMMIQDHQQGNQQLMQVAKQKGMDVPKRPDEMHAKATASMKNLSGAEFDRAYMSAQVADHQKMVSMYEDKAANATDPDVRSFAANQVPVVRRHLEQARQMQQSLGGPSAINAGGTVGGGGSSTADHSGHGTGGSRSNTSGTGTGTNR